MNLVTVIVASALSIVFLSAISQGIVGMARAQAQLEYLQDKSTAVFVIQSALNCQKTRPKGNACTEGTIDLLTQNGSALAPTAEGWAVGKAIITATCHEDGIQIYSQKSGSTSTPDELFPIRLCGNL